MYWTWDRRIKNLFKRIDPAAWSGLGENPVLLLRNLNQARIDELRNDSQFASRLAEAYEKQSSYLRKQDTWYQSTYGNLGSDFLVAYFSMEFGVASCLRTYSGGLGILAGDHLRSASDLGIPLVGVGLFYKRGYFAQAISQDGWQIELYPENQPDLLPVEPVLDQNSGEPLVLSVPVADRQVRVRAWKVSVGRVPLYLLDTNVPGLNSKEDCEITAELYGGDTDTRIKQEIILGFGGAKLMRALGIKPSLFHMNEGHSAFAGLERIRQIVEEDAPDKSFAAALEIVRSSSVFTTHTPVPAGIDIFSREQVEGYLSYLPRKLRISMEDMLSLGRENPNSAGFNMAVLAIRLSKDVNAVSKLHEQVTKKLWENLFANENFSFGNQGANRPKSERRVGSITNGIHVSYWISDNMADLYDEYLGKDWAEFDFNPQTWRKVMDIPSEVLWKTKSRERARFVEFVRQNFSHHLGVEAPDVLDPEALTIGFARRFATYKRATLAFSDHDRLARFLKDTQRPIQFVFSGKAHPRDHDGKRLIQEIINFAKTESIRGRIVFLSDYDISAARRIVQGVDLWLNNPRRPLEACGTSGMKVLANGGVNLSVLDGWWDEAYSPSLGWAIGTEAVGGDLALQDRQDSESLYDILEHQVIPEFYERSEDGVPRKWVERMKRSISTLAPRFSTNRMLMEYSRLVYFGDGKAN